MSEEAVYPEPESLGSSHGAETQQLDQQVPELAER